MTISILLAVLKLVLPAGTAAEPAVIAPVTPCSEAIAFWWDAEAFHAGEKSYAWTDLGVKPKDGAAFKVRYGKVGREDIDIDCTIDLSRPRFEIGSFGVIGNSPIKTKVKVRPTKGGQMRSYFVAQGQTPDFINNSKGFAVKAGAPYEFEITGRGSSSGDSWYHLYDTDGKEIYFSGCTYHDPKLIFDFQYVWTGAKKLQLHVVTQNWTDGLPGDYTLRVSAKDLWSNTLGSWTKTAKMRKAYGKEEYVFGVDDLLPGFYWLNVEYLDASGTVVHADKARYMKPMEKMPWEGTELGNEDTVPPPWTAPEFGEDGTFRCWNREFRFGGKGLVSSILNGGREQLAAPVALILDGRELAFDVAPKERKTASATYRLTARDADIAVDAVCEFDGYVKLLVEYGKGVGDLRCRVSLPRTDVVSFDDGASAKKDVFGKSGDFRRTIDINQMPWWWAGSVKGMMFGIFTMRGTHLRDYASAGEVRTAGDRFEMTMRIVDCPCGDAARRTARIYVNPTPVKPKNLAFAALPTERIVGWTGHLCEYFETKYPGFEVPSDFKRFSDELRKGKRVFFYNGTSACSVEDPFWGWYGSDWVRSAGADYYAHEAPFFTTERRKKGNWTFTCLNSKSYFEAKLWGVNWYLHEPVPEMKDLYFDLSNPCYRGCPNATHGCVFKDDFGRTMHDKNLETMREFLKRACRLVRAKNADGLLFGHVVTSRVPSDNFFDYISSGESLAADMRWQDSYYDVFTPDMVQAMFASKGVDTTVDVPPQFLRSRQCWDRAGYDNYNPNEPKLDRAIRHFIAYVKIHDLRIPRAPNAREGWQFAKVEGPVSSMGVGRRFWNYCTEGESPVTLSAPDPRQLWAYYANDRESVLIVLNDTDAEVEQTVTVKGLSAKGTELLDQTPFDFTSGSCTLKLGPRGAKFIRFPEGVK